MEDPGILSLYSFSFFFFYLLPTPTKGWNKICMMKIKTQILWLEEGRRRKRSVRRTKKRLRDDFQPLTTSQGDRRSNIKKALRSLVFDHMVYDQSTVATFGWKKSRATAYHLNRRLMKIYPSRVHFVPEIFTG